jgi:hypothetical protein
MEGRADERLSRLSSRPVTPTAPVPGVTVHPVAHLGPVARDGLSVGVGGAPPDPNQMPRPRGLVSDCFHVTGYRMGVDNSHDC